MITLSSERSGTVVFVPKNRGLRAQVSPLVDSLTRDPEAQACEVRGEDVPFLANQAAQTNRNVFAVTGEDLLEEWLAAGNVLDESLMRGRIPWNDPAALFGKPSLCLVGRNASPISAARRRVAICSRYARLAERTLRTLERSLGITLQRSYVQGALETVLAHDLADAIVDIVLTGASIRSYGFEILDVLFQSDLVTLETA